MPTIFWNLFTYLCNCNESYYTKMARIFITFREGRETLICNLLHLTSSNWITYLAESNLNSKLICVSGALIIFFSTVFPKLCFLASWTGGKDGYVAKKGEIKLPFFLDSFKESVVHKWSYEWSRLVEDEWWGPCLVRI